MDNINWGIDESEIESGYFGEVESDDPLIKLWIIDSPKAEITWIAWSFQTKREEVEKDKNIFTTFKETLQRRWKAWWDILTLWGKWDVWAVETWAKFWFNFLWTLADLWWDFASGLYEDVAPDIFKEKIKEWAEYLAETSWWEVVVWKLLEAQKNLEDLNEFDPVKWQRFQWWLDLINGLLAVVWVWEAEKAIQRAVTPWFKDLKAIPWDIIDKTKEIWGKIKEKIITKPSEGLEWDSLLKKLDLEIQKGMIDWVEVDIPKVDKTVVEKLSTPFREWDVKVLAGRALSPRTVWKSSKQKLESIQNVEKNANTFYNNVRTGIIEWDISTLENASQTVINNIDTIGARIWNAVKKIDWNIKIENELTDNIISALGAKWASVSPATTILNKFLDDLWDWTLSISDAFELKKAYWNEVSKLYKAWDSWTKQYKALSDWVKFLNTKIDDIIEKQLWEQFAKDKAIFRNLKLIVDDIVSSTLVEWRRAPNTFAEQLGMIEWLLSPLESTKKLFIKEIWELNTRGWAWKELIKIYDNNAITNFNWLNK